MEDRAVDVVLPLPVQTAFSYRVPDRLTPPVRGARVLVPFGKRRVIGVAVGESAVFRAPDQLKDIVDVLDETPLVPLPLLDLAAWVAEHYLAPPGECYRLIFPPSGIRASRAVVRLESGVVASDDPIERALGDAPLRLSALAHRLGRDPSSQLARLRREGRIVVEQDLTTHGFRKVKLVVRADVAVLPRGPAQTEILERLDRAGGRLKMADLVSDRPSWREAVHRLDRAGAVRIIEETESRQPTVLDGAPSAPAELTPDQRRALDTIESALSSRGFAPFLLHGVTGSGKTEVYFRAAERVLDAHRGTLVLVPEIALTPLLVRAATARFGDTVAVLHSELSQGERHDQWWRIRESECRVVIGARSAVFAPLADVGLVVVDEEHEAAYKQEESPRYNARDVAVVRGRLEGAAVILGSATPSVESESNARKGKYTGLRLPVRIGSQGLPRVEVVDRRRVISEGGDAVLTPRLREALAERLARGEQALLLLNRRGYATGLLCRECGTQATCPNCSVCLVLHDGGRVACCHYCGHDITTPSRCAACNGEYLRVTGYGTERVTESVRAAFPRARVERLDRDRVRKRGALTKILAAFEAGEIDVLVGTQMIAKGHDFPRVTLVGVVDADVGLGLPDFRSAERTFQLITQVSGRAGRADLPGLVVLQTHLPEHYALGCACSQDGPGFYDREMEFRRTMGYPPTLALVNLLVRARDPSDGIKTASALADDLRERARGRFRVLGPATAPLARLRGEHRFQVVLKGGRNAMREAVKAAMVARFGPVRWPGVSVDVDPLSVL